MNNILNWQLFLEELVGEKSIIDIQSYIDGMSLSMQDKLFFTDSINFDVIVDFGCADGSFLESLLRIKPDTKVIAYDLDPTMLSIARGKLGKNAVVTDNWDEVVNNLLKYKSPLLNLSSVIHEVYSYSHGSVIKKFWNEQVFGGDFKYITIRDMIPSIELGKQEISMFKDDVRNVRMKSDKYYLNSFEEKWGTISDNYKTFMHYLLKYRFTDNWEREVNENYLPVSLETLKSKIPSSYKIVMENDFLLPFLKQQVKKDFNVDLTHSTHTKMIIKNQNYK
jgi:ribosomal protein L11 methylase PrmA